VPIDWKLKQIIPSFSLC